MLGDALRNMGMPRSLLLLLSLSCPILGWRAAGPIILPNFPERPGHEHDHQHPIPRPPANNLSGR